MGSRRLRGIEIQSLCSGALFLTRSRYCVKFASSVSAHSSWAALIVPGVVNFSSAGDDAVLSIGLLVVGLTFIPICVANQAVVRVPSKRTLLHEVSQTNPIVRVRLHKRANHLRLSGWSWLHQFATHFTTALQIRIKFWFIQSSIANYACLDTGSFGNQFFHNWASFCGWKLSQGL